MVNYNSYKIEFDKDLPCSKDEFIRFKSIHQGFCYLLSNELDNSEYRYKQAEIYDQLEEFFPTLQRICKTNNITLNLELSAFRIVVLGYEDTYFNIPPDTILDGSEIPVEEYLVTQKEQLTQKATNTLNLVMARLKRHFNDLNENGKAEHWQQIVIEVVDDNTIKYKANGKKWERANYTELGFLDKRKHLANKLWLKFLSLATKNRPVSSLPKIVPKDIDRIRKELRKFFGLQEIPIRYDKKNKKYSCNFRFYDERNW